MTTFFFAGGEDHDFSKIGSIAVDTTTTFRRAANTRCSLKVTQQSGTNYADGWTANFSAPQSSFWLTARFYCVGTASAGNVLFRFTDSSGVVRLIIDIANFGSSLRFSKIDAAGTVTVLGSTTTLLAASQLSKIDVFVNYAASGSIQFYVDGTLTFSYSGNLLTNSATAIASAFLGGISGSAFYWSEVICADTDTRALGLVTLAPSANGNLFNWDVGSYTNISEITLDDTTLISSGTVGQVAQFTVGASGVTSGNVTIKGICISARAIKGATGPQNVKLGVRTGSADYVSAAIPMQSGAFGRIQTAFMTNPGTSNAWAVSEVSAAGFNIGVVSDT